MVNTMAESAHSKKVRNKPSPQGKSAKDMKSYFESVISGERFKKNLGIGKYSRAAKNKAAKDSKAIEKDASASRAKRSVMDRVNAEQGKVNRAKVRDEATKRNQAQIKAKSKEKNYNVGKSKGGVSFAEAFAHFRKKGAKTFTWNGKKYTTETAKKGKK